MQHCLLDVFGQARADSVAIVLQRIAPFRLKKDLMAVAFAEPLMLFFIAGFIGTIFISMVLPIFTLQDYIK